MSDRLRVHPRARRDAETATRWYREHGGIPVAIAFAHSVDEAIAAILQAPLRWAFKGKWRRYVLRRFPYVIAYRESGDEIIIGAVAHTRRDPGSWEER